ncbi:MAG: YraN family protein [Pseudomonadota bacterium]
MTLPRHKSTGFRRYASGVAAEESAERSYRLEGAEILERRYRTPEGEIDLVARDGDTIVFVEVKRRPRSMWDSPVSPRQWRRIAQAASRYLANPPQWCGGCRFDVALVGQDGRTDVIRNAHFVDAA